MDAKFKILGSSSSGNSGLLEVKGIKILIDAGLSCRKLQSLLHEQKTKIEEIEAVFLTHEHNDHSAGVRGLSRFQQLPIFANQDTKTPFYISLVSVLLNILISVYFFKDIGFIIIPIATTISSWFNSLILFIYLKNNNLFEFNKTFFKQFVKIIFASIIMGIFFQYLILLFENQLGYAYFFKSAYLLLCVLFTIIFYFAVSYFIKAFNYQDIKLKY